MIVVADSGPIHYLVLIGHIDVLAILYERVAVPGAVRGELTHRLAPPEVSHWIAHPPEWLEIREVASSADSALLRLDAGEREAILLAKEMDVEQILTDDRRAREAAERHQLEVIGTVGVLERASQQGLLDFGQAFADLTRTNFRISPSLVQMILSRIHQE